MFAAGLGLFSNLEFDVLPGHSKFLRGLKMLDKTGEREVQKIGVIYVGNGQVNQKEILGNEEASPMFNEFILSLGWLINVESHRGYLGGLDRSATTGICAPYYANYQTEVIYHVPSLMANSVSDDQQIHKKRHVGNDYVHIIWNEHFRDYRMETITSQFNFVHIVITPLESGLFAVRVHTKSDVAGLDGLGPLRSHMIISQDLLGPLVRQTAILANRKVRLLQEGYLRAFPTRQKSLDELIDRYASKLPKADIMRKVFLPAPTS